MEEYLDIKYYENYEVSDLGNVRNKITWKILKPRLRRGYYCVSLCKEGKVTTRYVHRLVCESFLENPERKPNVDHINNNKLNNNLKNLRWCNQKENLQVVYLDY